MGFLNFLSRPVLKRFKNMAAFDFIALSKVGDGTCEFEHAVIRARGESIFYMCRGKERAYGIGDGDKSFNFFKPHLRVSGNGEIAETFCLHGARLLHARAY